MTLAKVVTFDSYDDAKTIIEQIEKDGCAVIQGLLSDEEVSQLKQELGESFEKSPVCQGDFYGYSTKRLGALFTKSRVCQKAAINEKVLQIMDAFLLKSSEQYQINLTQGISIGSGEEAQIIHQDDPMYPFKHDDYEVMVNCMWAIDDFTTENGATYLVPGSHKWERNQIIDPAKMRLPQGNEITQGVMKAGSVLVWLGSLYHAGGNNMTSIPRRGAVISYCLGWLRQAENSYLVYSAEETASMPERLQRLLGYFVHSPNLGSVEGQDPIEILRGRNISHGQFQEFIPEEAKQILRQFKEEKKISSVA